ncbi:hypothetical protein THRCLA_10371, partial [Thraustotheca clavata]
ELLDSIDALLAFNEKDMEKKEAQSKKLQKIRQETKEFNEQEALNHVMDSEIAANLKDLQADEHLFSIEKQHEVEQFGYIFEPITKPIPLPVFTPPSSTNPKLAFLYKCIKDIKNDNELARLLYSKVILIYLFENCDASPLPKPIWEWLLNLVGSHPDLHIVRGAFINLFIALGASQNDVAKLTSGLPIALFAQHVSIPVQLDGNFEFNHFLDTFKNYGFQASKRSLSSVARATAREGPPTPKGAPLPFPSMNMEHIVILFILVLRSESIKLSDYDAFCAVIFFLRLQFEDVIRPQLRELTSYILECLLECFHPREWRKEYAGRLIEKIASTKEGFFNSAAGWLTIARCLPRTERGTQLTTGLAVYVLQYRIDRDDDTNEVPLKFPVHCELVLDIVASIVDSLTSLYAGNNTRETAPPYDMICMKIALMDLALQAYLNEVQTADIGLLLEKLDSLADTNKAMQCEEWHQLKTLVSMMHRKYAPEHLRIGRPGSPKAKTVLFIEE